MSSDSTKKDEGFLAKIRKNWKIYLIEFLLIALAGVLIWKYFSDQSAAKASKAKEEQIMKASEEKLKKENVRLLKLTTSPLVWVIRNEMMLDNNQQISIYLNQFVKDEYVHQAMVVDKKGKIIVATDKKIEGQAVNKVLPAISLTGKDMVVTTTRDDHIRIAKSIMGLEETLGILVVDYVKIDTRLNLRDSEE